MTERNREQYREGGAQIEQESTNNKQVGQREGLGVLQGPSSKAPFSSCFVTPLCRSGDVDVAVLVVACRACQLVFGGRQGSLRKLVGRHESLGADQLPLPHPPLSMALLIGETQFAEWSCLPHTLGSALSLATCNTCDCRASLCLGSQADGQS